MIIPLPFAQGKSQKPLFIRCLFLRHECVAESKLVRALSNLHSCLASDGACVWKECWGGVPLDSLPVPADENFHAGGNIGGMPAQPLEIILHLIPASMLEASVSHPSLLLLHVFCSSSSSSSHFVFMKFSLQRPLQQLCAVKLVSVLAFLSQGLSRSQQSLGKTWTYGATYLHRNFSKNWWVSAKPCFFTAAQCRFAVWAMRELLSQHGFRTPGTGSVLMFLGASWFQSFVCLWLHGVSLPSVLPA